MFAEIKADDRSLKSRGKKKFGVGINDADYFTQYNGDICPYYKKWSKMLERCYSPKWKKNKPTYAECLVCDEWLLFSAFKAWMITKDWQGKELDKDIINIGNKLYSPENCAFVSREINLLVQTYPNNGLLQGVTYHKRDKIYCAKVSHNGKAQHLGNFNLEIDAHNAYKKAKYKIIKEAAMTQLEPIKTALLNYKIGDFV